MVDPKDLKNANNESKNLNSNIENAKEAFDELLFAARDFSGEVAKSAKAVFQNTVQASEQAKSFKTLASLSRDFASEISDISDGTKSISNFNKLLIKQEEAKKKFVIEYRQALAQAGVDSDKISQITSGQLSMYEGLVNQVDTLNEDQIKLIKYYDEQLEILNSQDKVLGDIETRGKQIDKAFGAAGLSAETIETVLKKIGASKLTERLGISDAITKSRQFSADLTKVQEGPISMGKNIGNQFKVLGNLAGNVGGNLLKSLGPVALAIGAIVKIAQFFIGAMFDASKQTAEFQRDMGLTAEEAENVRQRTYDISQNSKNLADTQGKVLILQKQIVQAQKDANAALETQIDFTQDLGRFGEELLTQSALLKDNFKLGDKAIGEITNESIRTGKSVENITKKTLGTVAAVGLEKGILLDVNKILEEAGDIQGNIRLSFKGSTEELAKGVAQAKLLGITLKQSEGVARNLLNFEESISAEIEAELLTNQNINLEEARRLALNGDLVGVAKEINNQGITYNKLQNMNLIQRDAIARSLGMSTDELADQLKKQEEYNALQARAASMGVKIADIENKSLKQIFKENKEIGRSEKEIVKALGEELYQRKLAEDAQTKFNKALDLAKESFTRLVDSGALDKFANIITALADTIAGGTSIFSFFGDLKENTKKTEATNTIKKLEEKNNTGTELTEKEKEQLNSAKAYLKLSQTGLNGDKDVSIRNPNNKEERIVRKNEGMIRSSRDASGNYITNPSMEQQQEIIPLFKEMIAVMKQGGNVYLDSTKVGTAMAVGTFKTQ
jgi:hypothetical protein